MSETLGHALSEAKKADAEVKEAEPIYLAAYDAYMEDPEVIAAFALLKRKQAEHGETAAHERLWGARRIASRWWNMVDRLLPDPDGA